MKSNYGREVVILKKEKVKELENWLDELDKLSNERWKLNGEIQKIYDKVNNYEKGDVSNFQYMRGKYKDWFVETFGKKYASYSWYKNHGTKEEKDILWNKIQQIKKDAYNGRDVKQQELDNELWNLRRKINEKYPFIPISEGSYDDVFSTSNFISVIVEFIKGEYND